MLLTNSKPLICNVVCTANIEQKVSVTKLSELSCGQYDEAIYGGRCGYIKTPEMDGRVVIFPSGKMISIGSNSIRSSMKQLNHAKFYLVHENMIKDTKIVPIIRNIVSTIDIHQKLPLKKLCSKLRGAIYNPEDFPAIILHGFNRCTFLIFASGKIVITGAKSLEEVNRSSSELLERLNEFLN